MAFLYRGGPQSPRDDALTYPNPLSPARNPNRLSGGMMASDVRGGLTRRFTTNALPSLSPIGQQRKLAAGDYTPSGYARKTPSESAVRRYETLLAAQRELQRELDMVDPETRREVEEGLRHEESVTQMMASSEPAGPPEYANAFPSAFSRPNRYSATSLTSPPGITTRPARSSTQLTSPSASIVRPYTSGTAPNYPSQSVPGSRRHSDDEDDDEFHYGYDSDVHRMAANPNRNSMPITSYDRKRNSDTMSFMGPANTTSFLFDPDERPTSLQPKSTTTSPSDSNVYLQVQHTADGFPKLIRRGDNVELSSALDLAFSQGTEPQQQQAERTAASRHRVSLPPSALSGNVNIAPLNGILANAESKAAASNRRSGEVKFTAETKRPALMASPPRGMTSNTMQRAQSSYSTNDIPTLRSINGTVDSSAGLHLASPPSQVGTLVDPISPEQAAGAISHVTSPSVNPSRQSQDSILSSKPEEIHDHLGSVPSALQANAIPFGPTHANQEAPMQNFGPANAAPFLQPAFYNGYNMAMLNNSFANTNLNGGYGAAPGQWHNQIPVYPSNGYQAFPQFQPQGGHTVAGVGRLGDNQNNHRAPMHQRRQAHDDSVTRFNSVKVEDIVGEIYSLCKDQHGCRFLQRKLDERNNPTIQIIFNEVKNHIIELMTDPFGNYLCQKLLESTNDEQRTVLIQNAMPAMTKIALNQHGTRALQKMIEFISTPQQTQMIIEALRFDVVQLIQDLNGNHVIQKCLNHLTPEDAQFIFEAVGANCTTVGTHRHGCCVLQRCIDHASGLQKGALVDQVIANAFSLVQDPFGNYVVQYILDLSEPSFTEPLCKSFGGSVAFLSKQKFSSNVIEKCIRCAGEDTKRMLILEMLAPNELEKLLRDSFANYVVQTAMDFSDERVKLRLVEGIRPYLSSIRHTPYGRRIQNKIQDYDSRNSGPTSGIVTPVESNTGSPNGTLPYAPQSVPAGRGNRQGWYGPPPQWPANAGVTPTGPGGYSNGAFNTSGANSNNESINNGAAITSSPQSRNGHNNSAFPDPSTYQATNGFNNPAFLNMGRQAPPYGSHF